ncbi:MAG TPA: hypothetical protein VGQ39_11090 [Pyrinomonadaceae bacterium]|jgi:hypothetical protein|nr:hypothetical protein [Pyrinomonadaceae bacterium]
MSPSELWRFFPIGYLVTIAIEAPILVVGLSSRHSLRRRLFAGAWLTGCTYPIVTFVVPLMLATQSRRLLLLIAEVFAPVAECMLFWLAFGSSAESGRKDIWRDFLTIVVANLASFAVGEMLNAYQWFGLV